MTQYKTSSELKEQAKERLEGRYGSAMLVSCVLPGVVALVTIFPIIMLFMMLYSVYLVVNMESNGQGFDASSMTGVFLIYCILIVLCSFLAGVTNTGIAYFNLNLACGRHHSVADTFYGYQHHFGKSLGLIALQTIPRLLFMTPYLICCFAWEINRQTYWLAGAVVSYILAVIAAVFVQLMWSQSFYLLLDFPQKGVIDLLKLSMRIMKGHKRRLLYIQLSFIPLELLSICSFYIGYLWYVPYSKMTYTLFFLDLMQPKTLRNLLK